MPKVPGSNASTRRAHGGPRGEALLARHWGSDRAANPSAGEGTPVLAVASTPKTIAFRFATAPAVRTFGPTFRFTKSRSEASETKPRSQPHKADAKTSRQGKRMSEAPNPDFLLAEFKTQPIERGLQAPETRPRAFPRYLALCAKHRLNALSSRQVVLGQLIG
jgi:hypothetical protein